AGPRWGDPDRRARVGADGQPSGRRRPCGWPGVPAGGGAGGAVGSGGVAWRRAPQPTAGSVPRMNAIVTTRTHSLEGSMSTGTRITLSGTGNSSFGPSPRTLVMAVVRMETA